LAGEGKWSLLKETMAASATRMRAGLSTQWVLTCDSVKVRLYFRVEAATCAEATSFEGEGIT
jgi:hypothetical protein